MIKLETYYAEDVVQSSVESMGIADVVVSAIVLLPKSAVFGQPSVLRSRIDGGIRERSAPTAIQVEIPRLHSSAARAPFSIINNKRQMLTIAESSITPSNNTVQFMQNRPTKFNLVFACSVCLEMNILTKNLCLVQTTWYRDLENNMRLAEPFPQFSSTTTAHTEQPA